VRAVRGRGAIASPARTLQLNAPFGLSSAAGGSDSNTAPPSRQRSDNAPRGRRPSGDRSL